MELLDEHELKVIQKKKYKKDACASVIGLTLMKKFTLKRITKNNRSFFTFDFVFFTNVVISDSFIKY